MNTLHVGIIVMQQNDSLVSMKQQSRRRLRELAVCVCVAPIPSPTSLRQGPKPYAD